MAVNIPSIVEKYTEKGKILDDCEERHKRLTAKLEEQNDEFDKKLGLCAISLIIIFLVIFLLTYRKTFVIEFF